MWELSALTFGVLLQVWGALLAYRGFRIGWNDVAAETDRWAAPIIRRIDKLEAWLLRLIGRRPRTDVRFGHGVAEMALTAEMISAKKQYSLPSRDQDVRDVLDQLTVWINEAMFDISETNRRLNEGITSRKEEIRELDRRLTSALNTQAEEQRQRAVRGIRIEAAGFLILTLGSLLQAVAAFVGFDWIETFG